MTKTADERLADIEAQIEALADLAEAYPETRTAVGREIGRLLADHESILMTAVHHGFGKII